MTPALTGFIWAIISALCLGVGTFLYKVSARSLGASNTTFYYYLFSVVLATVVWFITPGKVDVNKQDLIWPALMAFFISASVWTFSSAVTTIDLSVASTVRALSFIPAIVLAFLLYDETISTKNIIAIILIIIAMFLLGIDAANRPE